MYFFNSAWAEVPSPESTSEMERPEFFFTAKAWGAFLYLFCFKVFFVFFWGEKFIPLESGFMLVVCAASVTLYDKKFDSRIKLSLTRTAPAKQGLSSRRASWPQQHKTPGWK